MKRIEEQAKELEIEVYRTTRSKDVAERCKWSYTKGAKYVLGEIENVLQGDLNSHSAFKLKCIKQIIDELKK